MDRMKVQPWGIFGGSGGGNAGVFIQREGDDHFRTFQEVFGTVSPSKFANIQLKVGDKVLLRSAGGGGYGNPLERDPALISEDLRAGMVSADYAQKNYGVTTPPPEILQRDVTPPNVAWQSQPRQDSVLMADPATPRRAPFDVKLLYSRQRTGSWRPLTTNYLDTKMYHCDCCGKWIPKQAWIDQELGPKLLFCNSNCAGLYQEYWLPRYASAILSAIT